MEFRFGFSLLVSLFFLVGFCFWLRTSGDFLKYIYIYIGDFYCFFVFRVV